MFLLKGRGKQAEKGEGRGSAFKSDIKKDIPIARNLMFWHKTFKEPSPKKLMSLCCRGKIMVFFPEPKE